MGKLLVITALALAVAIDAALAQDDVPSFEVVSVESTARARRADDRTGLSGGYDLDLEFTPGSGTAAGTSAPTEDSVSLFTALEEQLGLKLQATRSRITVLVIDRLELPTEN